ncbi:conjugal transfer protein TraF [Candidatus Enterovibrio escicola]|uniref:Plasmid conjugative transfer pilus assembly protein TraF n=1 Tax=Candidatus Enterovibrio escicola TaxID=1927127 RepID=A0A2A5T7F6_9GAMM|nr:conjugal transfer protein TraF [Candidatus Enterovibrio escacola]PCS24030.1 plasmid conjugative transfer pilus assembly protein TraF [Candidatus Enterovibrio escacola]
MQCKYLIILSLVFTAFAHAASTLNNDVQHSERTKAYYHDRERGWFWYEDPSEDEEKEVVKPQAKVSAPVQPVLSPREILKKQGEQWEDALAAAILEPSKENYKNYLAMTAQIQQQSQEFATGFKQAIWVTPEYDYTLQKPRTTQAIVAHNQEELRLNEQELYRLSQENGLIFFFRSDCPYCHRFAPVLKKFSEQYGFTIIPVSLDGGGLNEYQYPKRDYDLGRKLNVEVVPALFLVNPDTNSVSTIGYGYSDWSTLTTKVLFAAQQLEGTAKIKVGDVR